MGKLGTNQIAREVHTDKPNWWSSDEWSTSFWRKVRKTPGCWFWTGCTDKDGYGKYGKHRAHRVAFALATGRWPSLCVLHRCDNPTCVRFAHLFEGTNQENTADRQRKGRSARGEQQGTAKLTAAQVRRARRLWKPRKYSIYRLAREARVCFATMREAIHGITWRHI